MDPNQDPNQDLDPQDVDTKDIKLNPQDFVSQDVDTKDIKLNPQDFVPQDFDPQDVDTKDIKLNPQDFDPQDVDTKDIKTKDIKLYDTRPEYVTVDIDTENPDTEDWFASDGEPEAEIEIKVEEPEILRRLKGFFKSKPTLASFFSADLSTETERATRMANKLITEEKCPDKEVARELALLCLYDLVLLIDDSASMMDEEHGKRIDTLKTVLDSICKVYRHARPEGIVSVKFLNHPQGRKNVKSSAILDDHPWEGVTRIGSQVKKILDTFVFAKGKKLQRPLIIMAITDGEIQGERKDTLTSVIFRCMEALKKRNQENAVAFQFSKVGNDTKAGKFLRELDMHKQIGQHVDCLLEKQLEDIDNPAEKWSVLPKLLLGAISRMWDEQDTTVKAFDVDGGAHSRDDLEDIE